MSNPATHVPLLSVEEYLELEVASDVRHEYVAGMIYALAGTSKRHSEIVMNIAASLVIAARRSPCRVFESNVKLRAAEDLFYYPDLTVTCSPDRGDPLIEESPCLLVEVTSPSTERIDRHEKLAAYRQIASLRGYLIVSQERRLADWHWRSGEDEWRHQRLAGGGTIALPCPEMELTLDEIYEGVEVES